jgi:hypothetical protein
MRTDCLKKHQKETRPPPIGYSKMSVSAITFVQVITNAKKELIFGNDDFLCFELVFDKSVEI